LYITRVSVTVQTDAYLNLPYKMAV